MKEESIEKFSEGQEDHSLVSMDCCADEERKTWGVDGTFIPFFDAGSPLPTGSKGA